MNPSIQGQLQKEAWNRDTLNKPRVKELIEKLEESNPESEEVKELKTLLGLADPEPLPKTPEAEKDTEETEEGTKTEPEEDTVDSLVENNSKEELLRLAKKEKVEVSEHLTKGEIAELILDARNNPESQE